MKLLQKPILSHKQIKKAKVEQFADHDRKVPLWVDMLDRFDKSGCITMRRVKQ